MDQENQKAKEMKIKKGIKIYNDAIASIETEGLMGDQYISIDPEGNFTLLRGLAERSRKLGPSGHIRAGPQIRIWAI